jgi:Protein of unknown function (DUF3684)
MVSLPYRVGMLAEYGINLAIRTKAEVMHAVYAVGTEKRPLLDALEPRRPKGGFFSSLVSAFTGQSATPQSDSPALPQPPKDPTKLHEMSVTLTVFTAEVDVKVDKKLFAELLQSMEKTLLHGSGLIRFT